MSPKVAVDMKPATLPALAWVAGTVHEILVQPGEQFYVFGIQPTSGPTLFVRIADAHNGAPITNVTATSLIYDVLKEAYFRKLNVQVAYRDFGPIRRAGSISSASIGSS